ncbi:MAG: hypothetical protein AAGH92_09610 [Planctomycetota bacterium]
MNDGMNAKPTTTTDATEPMIRQWSEQLRWLSPDRRDELEDHLRSELRNLEDSQLSPRERVIIAADRLGQPLLPASHVGAFRITGPFAAAFCAIFLLTPICMFVIGHGVWEFERELDDWFGPTGDAIQDVLNGLTQPVAMLVILLLGAGLAWRLVQRQRRRV